MLVKINPKKAARTHMTAAVHQLRLANEQQTAGGWL
jgi:hypothetical protein